MTQTEIRREIAAVVPECLPDLAKEAEEVLGYQRQVVAADDPSAPTRQMLARLEIETLNQTDVLRYQLQMKQEAERAALEQALVRSTRPELPRIEWAETPIGQYREWIPEHVLLKAIQIKREMPDAELVVSHLVDSPDPFLVLLAPAQYRWQRERIWIEVWSEPEFEKRRA